MKFINTFSHKTQINKHAFNYTKPLPKLESAKENISTNINKQTFYKQLEKFNNDSKMLINQNLYKKPSKSSLEIKDLDLVGKGAKDLSVEKKQLSIVQSKHYPSSLRE